MSLGRGNFVTQNKILPGAYINFVNKKKSSSLISDRGIAAIATELDWGPDGKVFGVTSEEFQKNSKKHFGYDYNHKKLKGLRDLFKNIKMCYMFRLITEGENAENTYCVSKYKGLRGNDLKIVVKKNINEEKKVIVITVLDTEVVDSQVVLPNTDNLIDNDFVTWKKNIELKETAGLPLKGGSNGNNVTGGLYQKFLNMIEHYSFNTLGCLSTDKEIVDLFVNFTKRMRDEVGVKFQTVVYRNSADYEGVISVENKANDKEEYKSSLVYWVTGAQAACNINRSLTNTLYSGEFDIDVSYSQIEFTDAIITGKFIFHKVGDEVRVLEDINTLINFTDIKSEDFTANQTIRVLDQIGNDIASLFNKRYLGVVPNDEEGRISLWNDIVDHHKKLESIRAIEKFDPNDIKVLKGDNKNSVVINDIVEPINVMTHLYMTIILK